MAASGAATRVPLETLTELLAESDARTLRQFLINALSAAWAATRPNRF